MENLSHSLGSSDFMPHGYCFLWTPELVWTHVISDLIIATSYFSIPVALWYFAQKRPDVPFRWVFVLFGIFVMACGSTHLFSIWNIWQADYWPEAGMKVVTAAASLFTAIMLWPLLPRALAMPNRQQLAEAETKAQAAALYARSLIEASLDPLVTISAEGKVTDVNKASEQITGVTRERLIGSDFSDYFTEPEKARAGYKQVFSDGFVTDYPLAIRHRSGGVTHVLYNASVYRNEAGEVQGVFAAARDITKQREAEAALRVEAEERRKASDALEASARDLARSNAELEQFAYVASHDLQEPLRMVVGYVQLLEKRLADKLDVDTREFMGFAVDGALHMQNLIQDILAYSRVSSKGQPLAPVDSAAALKEALDQLASRIAETGAEVNAQSLPIVMADRTQLVQLFQNLIGNAIKFCMDRAPRIRVEAAQEAGRWRFSVTDNGIGITPEYRGQLFVIFKRLHTRREYPGTGIGLAICKRIVERHGGEIGIESAPDGGSVFWFTLPEEESP